MNEPSLSCLFECHMVDHKTEPSNLLNKQKDCSSAVAFDMVLECKSSQKVRLWFRALIGYSFSQLIIPPFIPSFENVNWLNHRRKKRFSETDQSEIVKSKEV